ncbi:hypothetical protein LP420_16860 [Massilia sp. B-10]|nr:hypothetical protein LP420_16860 [Massilia sp. B-10]
MKTPFTSLCLSAALLALQVALSPGRATRRRRAVGSGCRFPARGVVQKGSSATVLRVNGRSYTVTSATVFYGSAAAGRRAARD